mgnify:FL=1
MRKHLFICALVALCSCCGSKKAVNPASNNVNLEWRGFKKDHLPSGWKWDNGVLTHIKGGGDIITKEKYKNFILELDWKVEPGGNSGIFFHVSEDHDYVWLGGPEMQVLDNEAHQDGLDPRTSAGANYALHAPVEDVSNPAGEWNHIKLIVDGSHVEHWMNGTKLLEYELWSDDWKQRVAQSKFKDMPLYGMNKIGHIALQDHGDIVSYKNIIITPLK